MQQYRYLSATFAFLIFLALSYSAILAVEHRAATEPSGTGYTAPPLPGADPMQWHPPATMPSLVDPLTDQEFQRRAAALKLAENFDVAAAAGQRPLKVTLTRVDPDRPAEQAGLKVGDVVLAINGEPLRYDWEFEKLKVPGMDTTMSVVTAQGDRRRVTVPPGKMGVNTRTVWDATASWARLATRDARFESFVRIASAALENDPLLVGSAVARAQSAGYDGKLDGGILAGMAAEAAIASGRFEEGLNLGAVAMKGLPEQEKTLLAARLRSAAMATFKLQYCLDLAAEIPTLVTDHALDQRLRDQINAWRQQKKRDEPNPEQVLESFDFRDATDELVSLYAKNREHGGSEQIAAEISKKKSSSFSAPGGHFHICAWGPTSNNVDASMEFSFSASDKKETPYARVVSFGITDGDNVNDPLVKFTYFDNGLLEVARYSAEDFAITPPSTTDGRHHIRLIVVDQRCEVILDGNRIFYGPLMEKQHDRKLGFRMQTVGVKMNIHHFTWRIASERKTAE